MYIQYPVAADYMDLWFFASKDNHPSIVIIIHPHFVTMYNQVHGWRFVMVYCRHYAFGSVVSVGERTIFVIRFRWILFCPRRVFYQTRCVCLEIHCCQYIVAMGNVIFVDIVRNFSVFPECPRKRIDFLLYWWRGDRFVIVFRARCGQQRDRDKKRRDKTNVFHYCLLFCFT